MGKTISQRFVDGLSKRLLGVGAIAVKSQTSFIRFELDTIVGKLEINVSPDVKYGYTMFARFDDVAAAKKKFGCNPHSGKYNTHIGRTKGMTPETAIDICMGVINSTLPQKKVDFEYNPPAPTKVQLACNAIRAMFFDKHYNGVVPVGDLEIVNESPNWHRVWTKTAIQRAIKELKQEQYINLDKKKENWLWGLPGTHESLFPKDV